MNLNNFYSDISSFWESIYPIILFHFLFYIIYRFIFGELSLKAKLEAYTNSSRFESTKKLLQEFELWTKLPFLLLVAALVYLALFSSITNVISSVNLPPFRFVYSHDEFIREYPDKDNLVDIAKYSNDTSGEYYVINQLRAEHLEEYKAKHPDQYEAWVGWADNAFASRLRYLHLFECFLIVLIVVYVRQMITCKEKRLAITLKWLLVLLISVPVLFALRYQAEQKTESRYIGELIFVRNVLKADNANKQVWTQEQIERVKHNWALEDLQNHNHDLFWVSRIVENNTFLTAILGPRNLQTKPPHREKTDSNF